MRIGIDARELCGHADRRRPLPRAACCAQWAATSAAGAPRVRALRARTRSTVQPRRAPLRDARSSPAAGGTWWEQVTLPAATGRRSPRRLLRARLHRARCFTACRRSWRSTTSRSPRTRSGSALREGSRRRFADPRSRRRARGAVVTISEFSRGEIDRAPRCSIAAAITRHPARHRRRPIAAGESDTPHRAVPTGDRRALRRLDLQSPPHSRSHRAPSRSLAQAHRGRDARIWSATTAPIRARTSTALIAQSAGAAAHAVAPLRQPTTNWRTLYRQRAGVRVPVRIRRARTDTARGADRRRPVGPARHAGGARELRRRRALRADAATSERIADAHSNACSSTSSTRARLLAAAPAVLARYNWATRRRRRRSNWPSTGSAPR